VQNQPINSRSNSRLQKSSSIENDLSSQNQYQVIITTNKDTHGGIEFEKIKTKKNFPAMGKRTLNSN
jgi:hypothetical protein